MVPRANRVSRKILDNVWKRGKIIRSGTLIFRFAETEAKNPARISFIVPKAYGGAATRNLLRRRGYSAVRPHLKRIPKGIVGAFVFNPKTKDEKSFTQINKLVSEILKNFL